MTKKLVVFDMDKTLITGNTWADFNTALGVSHEQDWNLYSAFSKNEITYDAWLVELHKLYKLGENKHTKEQVLDYLTQYELAEGAAKAVQQIATTGHDTLLLTGSFQMTADAVAFELGINDAIATTRCIFDDEGHLKELASAGNERQAKVVTLKTYCTEKNIDLADCIVVGDGVNMLGLFELVEDSVAFESSTEEVLAAASHLISSLHELPSLVEQLT